MNGQASLPEIMELSIWEIQKDIAVDASKEYSAQYIAGFIKTMRNTQSNISWPILVNYRDKEFRLLSGSFYLDVYLYLGIEKANCIVYRNLSDIDEIRCASASQMCKPTASARLEHFIYLYHKIGIGKGMRQQERRKEIGRIMCETPRQVQKYEYIFLKGEKQLIQDILHNRIGMNQAIQRIKANK